MQNTGFSHVKMVLKICNTLIGADQDIETCEKVVVNASSNDTSIGF